MWVFSLSVACFKSSFSLQLSESSELSNHTTFFTAKFHMYPNVHRGEKVWKLCSKICRSSSVRFQVKLLVKQFALSQKRQKSTDFVSSPHWETEINCPLQVVEKKAIWLPKSFSYAEANFISFFYLGLQLSIEFNYM